METRDIYTTTVRHFLGPVLSLLDDESVTEILINGPETIYAERKGKLERIAGVRFASPGSLIAAARNIAEYAGRSIDDDNHSMDARLPDGSRVHVICPPCSRNGVCISIRKFKKSSFNLDKLVASGSLSAEAKEFLSLSVLLHKNIVIAGGTGTGKTSLLNALSAEIPEHERIIVIEDSSELQLNQPHTVYLEAQPARPDGSGQVTIRDLFVDSLRMRPDRIVVGEVRRGEALDLLQSMISGHSGALTTVHATTGATCRSPPLSRACKPAQRCSSSSRSAATKMVPGASGRSANVWDSTSRATTVSKTSMSSTPPEPMPRGCSKVNSAPPAPAPPSPTNPPRWVTPTG